jgi:hypothetical protein
MQPNDRGRDQMGDDRQRQDGMRNAGRPPQGAHRDRPHRIERSHQGRFRQAIRGLGIAELGAVTFGLDVGHRVPRTVALYPLPPSIIDAYPDYEGFEFFLVRGNIVVVDPDTLEIVDVFPA